MIDSNMMRREPPPVAEFGPPTVTKLGKLGVARERYVDTWLGERHWEEREMLLRPVIGKRGR
jgi:hypothetical protein